MTIQDATDAVDIAFIVGMIVVVLLFVGQRL